MSKFEYWLFFLVFLICLQFAYLVPPFQKPDEIGHFTQSLAISKGQFLCSRSSTFQIEQKYQEILQDKPLRNVIAHKDIKLSKSYILNQLKEPSPDTSGQTIKTFCSFSAVPYFPQALGIKLSSLFSHNGYIDFYSGRLTIFIACFAWFYLLYRKIVGEFKPILFFVFSLPMTLHQITAYSYDGAHIMLAMTLFTLIINARAGKKVALKVLALLFIILSLFLLSKPGYEAVTLFIFLIPFSKISPSKLHAWLKLLLISAGSILIEVVKNGFLLKEIFISPEKVHQIVYQPTNFFTLYPHTILNQWPFYIKGLMGIFGWLEYGFPDYVYAIILATGLILIIITRLPKHFVLTLRQFIWLSAVLLICAVALMTVFYFIWSRASTAIIDGVQGRYFIPLLPFIFFWLLQVRNYLFARYKLRIGEVKNIGVFKVILSIMLIWEVVITFELITSRFYR